MSERESSIPDLLSHNVKQPLAISVCLSVKKRSRVECEGRTLELFPRCVDSIVKAAEQLNPSKLFIKELVVVDWDSSDWPLQEWLWAAAGLIEICYVTTSEPFHRSTGRNLAASEASGACLFFLDSDMLITPGTLNRGFEIMKSGRVFFPKCFYFLDPDHETGFWSEGKGNCMIMRSVFDRTDGWPCPPEYRLDRNGDQRFFQAVRLMNIPLVVEASRGLFHQYHPGWSVNNIYARRKKLIRSTESENFEESIWRV